MSVDPVCGREVHPKQSQWLLYHRGSVYHFCSGACEHRFSEAPDDYLRVERTSDRTFSDVRAANSRRTKDLAMAH